jgi:hypothetical protein
MGQLSFFDTDKRLAALSAKGDPLEAIARLVPCGNAYAGITTETGWSFTTVAAATSGSSGSGDARG